MLACQRKKLPRQGAVKKIGEKEVLNLATIEGRRIYRERTYEMGVRQGYKCAICNRNLWSYNTQFDHEAGRTVGKRDDRIIDSKGDWINAALCEICNSLKGSKRYKWQSGVYKPVDKQERAA